MLGKLFEFTAGAVKDIYNVTADTAEYIYDDITSIPDAISKGWDEGLVTHDSKPEQPTQDQPTPTEAA